MSLKENKTFILLFFVYVENQKKEIFMLIVEKSPLSSNLQHEGNRKNGVFRGMPLKNL